MRPFVFPFSQHIGAPSVPVVQPGDRLLVIGHPYHEDLDIDSEEGTGKRERAAPLPCPGLRHELPDAGLAVVERLRHRGVRLVASGRRDALVLVVDARRRLQHPFQAPGTIQGRHAPLLVDVPHRVRDSISRSRETSCWMSAMGKSGQGHQGPQASSCQGAARRVRAAAGRPGCCTRAFSGCGFRPGGT